MVPLKPGTFSSLDDQFCWKSQYCKSNANFSLIWAKSITTWNTLVAANESIALIWGADLIQLTVHCPPHSPKTHTFNIMAQKWDNVTFPHIHRRKKNLLYSWCDTVVVSASVASATEQEDENENVPSRQSVSLKQLSGLYDFFSLSFFLSLCCQEWYAPRRLAFLCFL